jgi:hypothetical protein
MTNQYIQYTYHKTIQDKYALGAFAPMQCSHPHAHPSVMGMGAHAFKGEKNCRYQ